MPPGLRLLLLVSIFAGGGALSRFGDGPIAVRLPELLTGKPRALASLPAGN
jgi:hypothetical protein